MNRQGGVARALRRAVFIAAAAPAVVGVAAVIGGSAARSGTAREREGRVGSPDFKAERARMVALQIERRGVSDARVLEAMRGVPRHRFVPPEALSQAYDDHPLPIGHGQTISQPYIVALMTELAALTPRSRVLEIGTGSGYQAAVLSVLAAEVYSIEIVEPLGRAAARRLSEMGYANVEVRIGDGYAGWPDQAPFDAIVVTAAPEKVPAVLIDQLAEGGRIVVPVGAGIQDLVVLHKRDGRVTRKRIAGVRFVPMVGGADSTGAQR